MRVPCAVHVLSLYLCLCVSMSVSFWLCVFLFAGCCSHQRQFVVMTTQPPAPRTRWLSCRTGCSPFTFGRSTCRLFQRSASCHAPGQMQPRTASKERSRERSRERERQRDAHTYTHTHTHTHKLAVSLCPCFIFGRDRDKMHVIKRGHYGTTVLDSLSVQLANLRRSLSTAQVQRSLTVQCW